MDHSRLMERLRIQSIVQRLRRCYGDDQALDIVREALEKELGLTVPSKYSHDKNKKDMAKTDPNQRGVMVATLDHSVNSRY